MRNIVFVGLMGAGKTTVGRRLAKRHGLAFMDTDQEIEARSGAPIPTFLIWRARKAFESGSLGLFRRRWGVPVM